MKNTFHSILDFLINNWETGLVISAIVYDVAARLIKTEKNLSIVDNVIKVITAILRIIPNRDKEGQTHKLKMIAVLMMISFGAYSQGQMPAYKVVRFVNVLDSTTVPPVNGSIYYNEQSDKFRVYQNNAWYDLLNTGGGGSGTVSKAGNGLTLVGSDSIAGGGTLQDVFQIDMGDNDVSFTSAGTGDFEAQLSSGDINLQTVSGVGLYNAASHAFQGKVTFTPTATTAGFNFGSLAGNPSAPAAGDAWYNSSVGAHFLRNAGFSNPVLVGSLTSTRVPFASGTGTGAMSDDADLTFTTATNTLAADRVVVEPNATLPGLNIGTFSGSPSTLVDGDHWLNTSSNTISLRVNGQTNSILRATNIGSGRIPFYQGTNASVDSDGGFTFSQTNDVLSVGSLTALTTSTTPAINIGNFAGDPSVVSDGSLWYNSSLNALRARINGASVSLGAGITNSAAANELTKSDGTNIGASGLFSTSNGNITLGSASISGSRTINVASSSSSANLILQAKDNSATGVVDIRGKSLVWGTSSENTQWGVSNSFTSDTVQMNAGSNPSTGNGRDFDIKTTEVFDSGGGVSSGNVIIRSGSTIVDSGTANTGNVTLTIGTPSTLGTSGNIVLNPNQGFIVFQNLPTGCTGAPSGTLYNDAGTLKICP